MFVNKTTKAKLITIFLLFIALFSSAQNLSVEMDALMNGFVEEGKIHGCVTYIQQEGSTIHFKPYGFSDIERNKEMENDIIFRIASMTKVLTAAGALKMYEDGKFRMDDPVKKYIPQFENLKAMKNLGTDSAEVVDLERDVTIRDLFRHTAGFGMEYTPHENNDTIDKLYIEAKLSSTEQTAEDFINNISGIPLKYQPGSKWQYSYSNDILGFLVEIISGKTLHEYLDEVLFAPLEMKSTGFYVKKKDIERFSANYQYKDGKLALIDDPLKSNFLKLPTIYSGGGGFENNEGGIVTTAQDFSNFCNMILNYGKFGKKQILQPQTVELMISNQIESITDRNFYVSGYGMGVGVSNEKYCGKTKSVFWSGGPYNTTFTIDFEQKMISILLIQNSDWWHLAIINKFNQVINKNL